jgi:hypothetical protein
VVQFESLDKAQAWFNSRPLKEERASVAAKGGQAEIGAGIDQVRG